MSDNKIRSTDDHPYERSTDLIEGEGKKVIIYKAWQRSGALRRTLWLMIITATTLYSLIQFDSNQKELKNTQNDLAILQTRLDTKVERQQEGRKISLGISCGAIRGVQNAGREILTNQLDIPKELRKLLTNRENPRTRQFRTIYARAYNKEISKAILAESKKAGINADDVIDNNGSLDCDAFREKIGLQLGP